MVFVLSGFEHAHPLDTSPSFCANATLADKNRKPITNPIFFILILLQSSYGLDEINVYSRVSRQFIAICASLDPFGGAAHITYVGLGSLDVRAVVGNELP